MFKEESSQLQGKAYQGEMQAGVGKQSDDSQGISTHSRCVSCHAIGSPACSPALQSIAVSAKRRSPPPLIRYDSDSIFSVRRVDRLFEPGQ